MNHSELCCHELIFLHFQKKVTGQAQPENFGFSVFKLIPVSLCMDQVLCDSCNVAKINNSLSASEKRMQGSKLNN